MSGMELAPGTGQGTDLAVSRLWVLTEISWGPDDVQHFFPCRSFYPGPGHWVAPNVSYNMHTNTLLHKLWLGKCTIIQSFNHHIMAMNGEKGTSTSVALCLGARIMRDANEAKSPSISHSIICGWHTSGSFFNSKWTYKPTVLQQVWPPATAGCQSLGLK